MVTKKLKTSASEVGYRRRNLSAKKEKVDKDCQSERFLPTKKTKKKKRKGGSVMIGPDLNSQVSEKSPERRDP